MMDLKLMNTTEILLKVKVKKIIFTGNEGLLTILPKHADYITSFSSNVMSYIDENDMEKYISLNSGSFLKCKQEVSVMTILATTADTLQELKEKTKNLITEQKEHEKDLVKNLQQLNHYLMEGIKKL